MSFLVSAQPHALPGSLPWEVGESAVRVPLAPEWPVVLWPKLCQAAFAKLEVANVKTREVSDAVSVRAAWHFTHCLRGKDALRSEICILRICFSVKA